MLLVGSYYIELSAGKTFEVCDQFTDLRDSQLFILAFGLFWFFCLLPHLHEFLLSV